VAIGHLGVRVRCHGNIRSTDATVNVELSAEEPEPTKFHCAIGVVIELVDLVDVMFAGTPHGHIHVQRAV